jgi:hypothetical protein
MRRNGLALRLLQERRKRIARFGRTQRLREEFQLFIDAGVQNRHVAAHQAPRRQQSAARLGGLSFGLFASVAVEMFGLNQRIDEVKPQSFGGVEGFAKQQEFTGLGAAKTLRGEQR